MRLMYLALSCCLFLNAGCGNNATTNTGQTSTATAARQQGPVRSSLDSAGTAILLSAVSKYYVLKNALVATKAMNADSAAARLATAGDSLAAYLQTDTVHYVALKPFVDTIGAESKVIRGTTDESCERQRVAFGPLSSAMFGLLKRADLKNMAIYNQYCPMAFNEKGATWLSDETDIKNPYFGKKMMECGEVRDSLK